MVDTETPDYETWQAVYAEHGAELPLGRWATYVGTSAPRFDPYAELERQIGRPIDRAALRADRQARYDSIAHALPLLPGVLDALDTCAARGLPIAVASSSPRWWVEGHLARLGLRSRFGAVKTADDVARTKPEPDLFLAACDAISIAPAAALAIEDSPNGALAAARAGLYCVVVPNTITRTFTFGQLDRRIESLAAEPFAAILDAAGGHRDQP